MKSMERIIREAFEAYHEGTEEGIQKILDEWEEEVKQGSEIEEDMDDQSKLVSDPSNTRGQIMQFKQTLYLYWMMKSVLGKAMESTLVGMVISL